MRIPILSMILLALTQTALAEVTSSQTTYQTLYTCQQTDGDEWLEVGLVATAGSASGYNILVVKHTDDGQKNKLMDVAAVVAQKLPQSVTYEDQLSSLRLEVTEAASEYTGQFSMLVDGPGSISDLKMDCFHNSDISFDSNFQTEPRISVGN